MPPSLRRILRRTAATTALLLAVAGGTVATLGMSSLPTYSGEFRLAGLAGPVQVVRDRWAIPHVRAGSPEDAYVAMGFLHAQDRLWQMEFNRRVGRGRLAEVLGPDALPVDRFMRTLGLARAAEASVAHLAPGPLRLLEAYARGVNGFLAASRRPLPPEFQILRHPAPEPWRPADSVMFLKLMALDLGGNWRGELARARLAARLTPEQLADLWPDTRPGDPVTHAAAAAASTAATRDLPLEALAAALPVPPALGGLGSNVWAVAGGRTASGAPLLANDPHLALSAPGPWYLAHVEAPGLAAIGATLPSVPFVVLGRNPDVAWGFTNTGSDVQDLFVETVDPADPGRYLTPDGPTPFEARVEEIAVRGAELERLTVRGTRHGPVLSDLVGAAAGVAGGGRVMALAWTGLDPADRTAEAGFAVALARDWASFTAAFATFAAPQQNIAYADTGGRVGLFSPGRVPVRRAGDGTLPVPGDTGAFDWVGHIPAEELPRTVDPPVGFLLNANNRLVGPEYPRLLAATWEPAYRARRIGEVLEAAPTADLDAMRALQLDTLSVRARDDLLPHLRDAAVAMAGAPAGLADALRAWDGSLDAGRPEPLVLAAWHRALGPLVWADELGPWDGGSVPDADFLPRVLGSRPVWCDDVGTAGVAETCAGQAARALDSALASLTATFGPDWRGWRWGAAHPAVLAHRPLERAGWPLRALFSVRVPAGGDGTTVSAAPPSSGTGGLPGEPFATGHGAAYRGLYDLADPDASRFVAATGQSGHPLSRHYRDLARLWAIGGYAAMSRRLADAEDGAVGRLTLRP